MMKTVILLLALTSFVKCSVKRHVIYWNSITSSQMLGVNSDHILEVKMGQFLDIICPQTSLMDSTYGPDTTETFDLYNVTKPHFDECHHGGRKNFIFACDRPERENKLTIKFQTISPSPLGFRFQYCQDYYFVAFPRNSKEVGCQNKTSTRLHIHVACRRPRTSKPSTSTTSPTTVTASAPPSDVDREGGLIIPEIIRPRPTIKTIDAEPNLQPQTSDKKKPENSSPRHVLKTTLLTISVFLSLVFSHALTASDHVR